MNFKEVFLSYGFVLSKNGEIDIWTNSRTNLTIHMSKKHKPYIFHFAIDPLTDCFETPEELDSYLKKEFIGEILHT